MARVYPGQQFLAGILVGMIAVMFPGQGSQKPGMGSELFQRRPEARQTFQEVSDATGIDVAKLCFESDEDTLRQTQNAQIALFASGVAAYRCLAAHLSGVMAIDAFAGHSIGEYAALVASGTLGLADGAKLVRLRGDLMARAGETASGTMAAVLGLERAELQAVCEATDGVVVIANDNCPGQLVISGERSAVERAGEAASAAGAKRVLPLNVSGAFHSPLMEASAEGMRPALESTSFALAGRVFSNVTAQPVVQDGRWPELLVRQLKSPVRWTESVMNMRNEGTHTFIECGVGDVLCGLLKRIDREATGLKVQDLDSLEATVAAIRA